MQWMWIGWNQVDGGSGMLRWRGGVGMDVDRVESSGGEMRRWDAEVDEWIRHLDRWSEVEQVWMWIVE